MYSLYPVYFWDKLCSGNLAYYLVLILKSLPEDFAGPQQQAPMHNSPSFFIFVGH